MESNNRKSVTFNKIFLHLSILHSKWIYVTKQVPSSSDENPIDILLSGSGVFGT